MLNYRPLLSRLPALTTTLMPAGQPSFGAPGVASAARPARRATLLSAAEASRDAGLPLGPRQDVVSAILMLLIAALLQYALAGAHGTPADLLMQRVSLGACVVFAARAIWRLSRPATARVTGASRESC